LTRENLALAGFLRENRPVKLFPLARFIAPLCAASFLLFAPRLPAEDASPEQTKAAITKSLNDFLAFGADPAQHDRFWADDLVYTTSAGKVKTKPEIMQAFADAAKPGAPKPAPRASYSAEDVLVRLYGDTAALTFRLVAHNADGSVSTYRNSGTFLKRRGLWQVITWQSTREPAAPAK
jgi:hypothetical protein